jgi:hypothetical protein
VSGLTSPCSGRAAARRDPRRERPGPRPAAEGQLVSWPAKVCGLRQCRLSILAFCVTAGCAVERPWGTAQSPRTPVAEAHQLAPATQEVAFHQVSRGPVVQLGPGVTAADAESLQQLVSDWGYELKFIELVSPAQYRVHVWGVIPHAASHFVLERTSAGWQVLGEAPWVLLGSVSGQLTSPCSGRAAARRGSRRGLGGPRPAAEGQRVRLAPQTLREAAS